MRQLGKFWSQICWNFSKNFEKNLKVCRIFFCGNSAHIKIFANLSKICGERNDLCFYRTTLSSVLSSVDFERSLIVSNANCLRAVWLVIIDLFIQSVPFNWRSYKHGSRNFSLSMFDIFLIFDFIKL